MHPAYSVIFFTTASGAGYGLLAVLSLAGAFGLAAPDRTLGIAGFGLAFALITAGLLSSTFHLGRPERAWRAFSEWRTSWLSREGVVAVATYVPAGLMALGWIVLGRTDGLFAGLGILTAMAAAATVYCTGQIYATLPTIRQWQQPLTTPVYLILALATGALLAAFLMNVLGQGGWSPTARLAFLAFIVGLFLKTRYWHAIDTTPPRYTIGRQRASAISARCARSIHLIRSRTSSCARWAIRSRASTPGGCVASSSSLCSPCRWLCWPSPAPRRR